MGIIKSGINPEAYGSLLNTRPDYMLPFGSRYRVIDITLSNMNEHGVTNVLLHGSRHIRSTLDHVGNGSHWEMDKRQNGLVITAPSYEVMDSRNERILSYYSSLQFVEDSPCENIYIANPMLIARVDITSAYEEFLENDYDVMFLYRRQEDEENRYLNARKIIFDEQGKIENIGVNLGSEKVFNLFMDHIIIKKDVFTKVITEAREKENAYTLSQAVMNYKDSLNVGTYQIVSHVEYIRDLYSYYQANINLLRIGIYADLFMFGSGILTKNKDEPSTLYLEGNKVSNSIVANGSILAGEVSNSILFRGVKVGKDAIVKNSIIFEGVVIEDGAIVVNSIIDKNSVIKKGVFVQGTSTNPYLVPKKSVLEK